MMDFICKTDQLYEKALKNERLSAKEALYLFENANLIDLGYVANTIRNSKHPDSEPITFVIDRNINYTNICECQCLFCAFHKAPDDPEGYVLDYETIKNKIIELININGTQLLLQGGLNPDLKLDYYINLLKNLRKDFKDLTIHAFSPPEIAYIAMKNGLSTIELLKRLKEAGLNSLPGGGAEILVDNIRNRLSPNKINSSQWLNIMQEAQTLNLGTSATMMAGSVESYKDIIEHLIKIRDLQDNTGGFRAFIPWTFQNNNTKVFPERIYSGYEYLKLVSISRIVLDNIDNIQVSWPTQGIKLAQLALSFGANDFGGVMMEENVIASTGLEIKSSVEIIIQSIKALNRIPAQRNTNYKILKVY